MGSLGLAGAVGGRFRCWSRPGRVLVAVGGRGVLGPGFRGPLWKVKVGIGTSRVIGCEEGVRGVQGWDEAVGGAWLCVVHNVLRKGLGFAGFGGGCTRKGISPRKHAGSERDYYQTRAQTTPGPHTKFQGSATPTKKSWSSAGPAHRRGVRRARGQGLYWVTCIK